MAAGILLPAATNYNVSTNYSRPQDPVASYDMNGRDPDPSPHYSSSADN